MRFPEIERIVMDAVDALVAAGVSRVAAVKAMQDAELVAVLDVIETQQDRRLLDLFSGDYDRAEIARSKGVTVRTLNTWKNDAAERLAKKKIGSDASGSIAA